MADLVRAVSDYTTEDENYLSFQKGEGFQVINRQHSGWLWVKSMHSEQTGYIPRTYVEPMDLKVRAAAFAIRKHNTERHTCCEHIEAHGAKRPSLRSTHCNRFLTTLSLLY
jgi:hypothetical protein